MIQPEPGGLSCLAPGESTTFEREVYRIAGGAVTQLTSDPAPDDVVDVVRPLPPSFPAPGFVFLPRVRGATSSTTLKLFDAATGLTMDLETTPGRYDLLGLSFP